MWFKNRRAKVRQQSKSADQCKTSASKSNNGQPPSTSAQKSASSTTMSVSMPPMSTTSGSTSQRASPHSVPIPSSSSPNHLLKQDAITTSVASHSSAPLMTSSSPSLNPQGDMMSMPADRNSAAAPSYNYTDHTRYQPAGRSSVYASGSSPNTTSMNMMHGMDMMSSAGQMSHPGLMHPPNYDNAWTGIGDGNFGLHTDSYGFYHGSTYAPGPHSFQNVSSLQQPGQAVPRASQPLYNPAAATDTTQHPRNGSSTPGLFPPPPQ